MEKFDFKMTVETDHNTEKLLAVFFHIRRGEVAEVREFADGNAFANYGHQGQLLGIELLGPCRIEVLDKIARGEPKAKRFIRNSLPTSLALTA